MKNLYKAIVFLLIIITLIIIIANLDFPTPNKTIEMIIPNENFKITK
jgi:hypothetical protein